MFFCQNRFIPYFVCNFKLQIRIVAVDLQPMSPLPGVIQLQGDITEVVHLFYKNFGFLIYIYIFFFYFLENHAFKINVL